jgi:hypothetical protein
MRNEEEAAWGLGPAYEQDPAPAAPGAEADHLVAREGARIGGANRRAARPIARRARASGNDLPAAADSLAGRQDLHRRLFMQEAADR